MEPIDLKEPIDILVSRPGIRTSCSQCGEEIINEREFKIDERVVCRSCAGEIYYYPLAMADKNVSLENFYALHNPQ